MSLFLTKDSSLICGIKDIDGKKGIVSGYFAAFDNVDSDGDVIRKGAFTKTIIENGPGSTQPRIKHLQNHRTDQPLGKITSLSEDTKGLVYESQVGTHTLGSDFVKMVESGLITEHSIGYRTIKRNQLQDYEGYMKNPGKGWYELTELKLWEGSSLTAWGANSNTPLTGMKSQWGQDDLQRLINRQEGLEKFCRNTTATDETIELLLLEAKQLTQIIYDIKSTKPGKTTSPDRSKEFAKTIQSFTKTLK